MRVSVHSLCRQHYLVGWTPPNRGWVKINADGDFKRSTGRAYAGGLIRGSYEWWLAGFSYNTDSCSSLCAELWGAFIGLKLVWNSGYKHVILESNSKVLEQLTKGREPVDNANGALVANIQKLLDRAWRAEVVHTYRVGNTYVDWLANYAASLDLGLHYFSDPPMGLYELIGRDISGVSFSWFCIV